MATELATIRPLVRAVLSDSDSQNFLYTDEVIDQHIALIVMVEDDPTVQLVETNPPVLFTTVLTAKQKALLTYRVAQSILSPNAEYFSYKSPILTVTRSGGTLQLLSHIQRTIDRLQGGFLALQEDNELWAFVNGFDRWSKDWSDIPLESA